MASGGRWGGYYNEKGKFIYGQVPAHVVQKEQYQLAKHAAAAAQRNDPFMNFEQDDEAAAADALPSDDRGGGPTEACLLDPGLASASSGALASGSSAANGGSSSSSSSTSAPKQADLPPPPSDSEDEEPDAETKERMNDVFASFMSEVNTIGSRRQKANTKKFGSAAELIERILDKARSPFEILGVTPDAAVSEITKTYRNISRIIHPDKCRIERAHDAFQKLLEAYSELKDGKGKERYAEIWEEVKTTLLRQREEINAEKLKKGEDDLLPTEGQEFDEAVIAACEDRLENKVEEEDYASKVRKANEERIKEREEKEREEKRKQANMEKSFKKNMDKRVAGWQSFNANIASKRFKSNAWGMVGVVGAADRHHKREEKTELQREQENRNIAEGGQKRKAAGVDDEFKTKWR
ncbi:unnamed protein product [Amoebophrya sp. A25]|nr:unnamed protein product [Amoebophrya sp. A25]|eukprot:GSA25T00024685001.1